MLTRRDALRAGVLLPFGLTLADRLRAAPAKERSCILLWLDGGPSHLDTFDPKPDAPVEVRGPFDSIATRTTGIRLNEHLPRLAAMMDRLAVVRSITSPLGEHNLGSHYMLTGHRPVPALVHPSHGAILTTLRNRETVLPSHVVVPDAVPYAGSGFLGEQGRPFEVGGDPARADFRVRDLEPPAGLTRERLERRRAFRDMLDDRETDDPALLQAYRLLLSPKAKEAFDLTREPGKLREQYGTRTVGQSLLLARRLVEAGVSFVTVVDRGWDTHDRIVNRLKEGFTGGRVGKVPSLDQALSSLLDDLHGRGMSDSTLVVVMGEFGRTPRINTLGGRDHWPRVFSVLLAGGGAKGGQVVGRSDSKGEGPAERPVVPEDVACTIQQLLGIPARAEVKTSDGRPMRVRPEGKVIYELM